jgi:hypothetical protein
METPEDLSKERLIKDLVTLQHPIDPVMSASKKHYANRF